MPSVANGEFAPLCGAVATFSGNSEDPSRPVREGVVTLGNNNYNIEIMMKRYWQNYLLPSLTRRGLGVGLLLALLAFTACSSDDDGNKKDDTLTAQELTGLWVAEYDQSATEDGITWTRVVEDFLFRANGTGYWEIYLLDANKLVGADGDRDTDKTHYTISGNIVNITIDNSIIECTLTYADGKLTDTDEGVVYRKATTEQQTLVEQLYNDWKGMNSGTKDDGSTINTDVTDSYTDEPARARRR